MYIVQIASHSFLSPIFFFGKMTVSNSQRSRLELSNHQQSLEYVGPIHKNIKGQKVKILIRGAPKSIEPLLFQADNDNNGVIFQKFILLLLLFSLLLLLLLLVYEFVVVAVLQMLLTLIQCGCCCCCCYYLYMSLLLERVCFAVAFATII